VSAAELFYKGRWLVLKERDPYFETLNIPFDCEFLVLENTHLEEAYRTSLEFPVVYTKFGDLQPETWPLFDHYRRRSNLQGYVMKTTNGIKLEGYFGQIWRLLESVMNFTSEIQESADGGTGSIVNDRWNGMVGMLMRNEVMFGASSFLITTQRMDVVDFTYTLLDTGNYVYIKKPDNYLLPWTNSLAPFTARLWFCVLAIIFIFIIALATTASLIHRSGVYDDSEFCLRNAWLYVFGKFCNQGHDICPLSLACRIVYITAYFCAFVLLAGYGGNYTSFLTAGRPLALPFNTFQEMLDEGTYKLGSIHKSAQIDMFTKAREGIFMGLYNKLVQPYMDNLPTNYADAFQRVCDSKYAFMSPAVFKKKYTVNSTCEIIRVPHAVIPGHAAMAARKKFGLLEIMEKRTIDIKKMQIGQKDWDAISLDEIIPILSAFLLGVLASVLIAFSECFVFRVWLKRSISQKENRPAL
ncbi:hypothetical protein L9F63_022020, partial [Diploptera punctata]